MLTLLKIRNIALIDELDVEFGDGLNLLTGETGSGKSIIVDSLGALTGDRVSVDLIKQGETAAAIEGVFQVGEDKAIKNILDDSGIEFGFPELIIRRELSFEGKNRIFVNGQLVTQGFLRNLGTQLVNIHGQGDQDTLYDAATYIDMLDDFVGVAPEKAAVANAFHAWSVVRDELASLKKDESEKLQLLDILRFQADEIRKADMKPGEDADLDDEKRRLNNVERLSALSAEAHSLLYDDEHSTLATLDRAAKAITELAEYDARFRGFDAGLDAARAVVAELGSAARDFGDSLEFSPERLSEIEGRLDEISRLKRKYGDSIDAVLDHLADAERRLANIETAELREEELTRELATCHAAYGEIAGKLHAKRVSSAAKFTQRVENDLKSVALEKARFEARIIETDEPGADGTDRVDFYFSANPGEPPRSLARVASGGEASRLMLVLKTVGIAKTANKTAVFDEIDVGIGGRVAEAVGRKLKGLAAGQQVFCVTHQPQIASLADRHFVVEKNIQHGKTSICVRELSDREKIEELARMLAGEHITDQARENAKAMLASAGKN